MQEMSVPDAAPRAVALCADQQPIAPNRHAPKRAINGYMLQRHYQRAVCPRLQLAVHLTRAQASEVELLETA